MNNQLEELLRSLIQSGNTDNPALNFLINDYRKYHLVMVTLGSLSLIVLGVFSIHQFKLLKSGNGFKDNLQTIHGKMTLYFASLSSLLLFALGLIVVGNAINAGKPRTGFKESLSILSTNSIGTHQILIQGEFIKWINSGKEQVPNYISRAISERLAWQQPKAIISLILLLFTLYLLKVIFKSFVQKLSPTSKLKVSLKICAVAMLPLTAVLFLVMFIGNSQGSLAPMALTLFFS